MSASNAQPIFGRWSLAPAENKPAVGKLEIGTPADNVETALADDSRAVIQKADIQPGGKYYSIVKLQIRFEKQLSGDDRWAQGTGWLIADNLVVTAGHCAFDHTYNFGKAVKIRAYISYDGKGSIEKPDVQFRQGVKIATTKEWIASDINRANDVRMFMDSAPRTRASVIRGRYGNYYKGMVDAVNSTEAAIATINGVEYTKITQPEAAIIEKPVGDEESFWDTFNNVVNIGAKIGSTVLQARYNETRHLMPKVAKLIAPAITEPTLRIALNSQASDITSKTYPNMPSTKEALDSSVQPFEDFFGILSSVANTAVNVVSTATPIIKAVSSIVGAIGGGAEDSFQPNSDDLSTHVEVLCHGALLGDAALHALMTIPARDIEEEGFFGDLVGTVKSIGSTVIKVAPTVIKTVTPIIQSLVSAMNQPGIENSADKDTQVRIVPSLLDQVQEPEQDEQIQLPKQGDGLAWGAI
ncbi:glutamyl endopeptidase [Fusarium longipes]|uniref:Glutamyl endopeptidase n=1 Tax=Fusarium longipes TaxID=694270 RepID=A0A395RR05_9HYPO|nr:glutamyl endopeptidase [Fusarium longipes]